MRTLVIALSLTTAATAAPITVVDIDEPQALDRVRLENPAHYVKIAKVLAAAEQVPAFQLRDWLPTAVGASDVLAAPLWLVSDPPKMKLAFTLDATRYTATVTVRFPPAQPKPAR